MYSSFERARSNRYGISQKEFPLFSKMLGEVSMTINPNNNVLHCDAHLCSAIRNIKIWHDLIGIKNIMGYFLNYRVKRIIS